MYKGSRVLYLICAILAAISVLVGVACVWLGIRGYVGAGALLNNTQFGTEVKNAYEQMTHQVLTLEVFKQGLLAISIFMGVLACLDLLILIFALWARRSVLYSSSAAPHVFCLLFSILSGNVLLLIASILGLIASEKNKNTAN